MILNFFCKFLTSFIGFLYKTVLFIYSFLIISFLYSFRKAANFTTLQEPMQEGHDSDNELYGNAENNGDVDANKSGEAPAATLGKCFDNLA